MKSSDFFTAIGTSLRESTSIEPFYVKIGWGGLTSRAVGEKVRKSREAPIGMMCCRQHTACATAQPVMSHTKVTYLCTME